MTKGHERGVPFDRGSLATGVAAGRDSSANPASKLRSLSPVTGRPSYASPLASKRTHLWSFKHNTHAATPARLSPTAALASLWGVSLLQSSSGCRTGLSARACSDPEDRSELGLTNTRALVVRVGNVVPPLRREHHLRRHRAMEVELSVRHSGRGEGGSVETTPTSPNLEGK